MKTSAAGGDFIKRFEGLELDAYQDIAGVWTIGYGHTGAEAYEGNRITETKAGALLHADLGPVDRLIDDFFRGDQAQWEHDALASFLFNVGTGAFDRSYAPSTTRRAELARGAMRDHYRSEPSWRRSQALKPLADAMLWWDKALDAKAGVKRPVAGLTRRRIEEAELLLYADYHLSNDGVVNAPGVKP